MSKGLPVLRVIFTGSRHWADRHLVQWALRSVDVYANHIAMELEVVHGDYPDGLDFIVDREAKAMGIRRDPHPARWTALGLKAGPIRNQEMVDSLPKPWLCVAFPIGEQRSGTRDCMARARAAGIPIWLPAMGHPLSSVLS